MSKRKYMKITYKNRPVLDNKVGIEYEVDTF